MTDLPANIRDSIDSVLAIGNGRCKYAVVCPPEHLEAAEAYARGRRNRAGLRFMTPAEWLSVANGWPPSRLIDPPRVAP